MACRSTSSSIVIEALIALPYRKELQVDSSRTRSVKKFSEELLTILRNNDQELQDKFKAFAEELHATLNSIMETTQPSTMVKLRENMWMKYASVRANKLPPLWRRFLTDINCEAHCNEPLLAELVNETILDSLINTTFPEFNMTRATPMIDITKDEENILRYACGFIGMKLRQKFLKMEGEKAAQFVECLNRMHNDGPMTSFLDYTREWVQKINRGGLFVVSDEAYRFFVSLEQATRSKLPGHLIETATRTLSSLSEEKPEGLSAMVKSICEDDDLLFHWTFVGMDVEDEDNNLELLEHIVHLWVNIRGFSISKAWMEEYKAALAITTQKKKSLRKQLKLS